jgi:predicted chitinase
VGVVLTEAILQAVCRFTSPGLVRAAVPELQSALDWACCTTKERAAAFLAQVCFESDFLRAMVERPTADTGPAFEGYDPPGHRAQRLGNTQRGDGARFRGRGRIQLTGRANYTRAGAALGVDLVGHPELAAEPSIAARVAAWYWLEHGCNAAADQEDLEAVTRKINGGLNGYAQRVEAYQRARAALGLPRWQGQARAG